METTSFIERLEHSRPSGPDSWMAQCPAHDDGSASLSVRSAEGCTLINCFAGCLAVDVVAAMGLSLSDLFADTLPSAPRPAYVPKPTPPQDPLVGVMAALGELGASAYVCTGDLSYAGFCPACDSHLVDQRCLRFWQHEDGGRVELYCRQGCDEDYIRSLLTDLWRQRRARKPLEKYRKWDDVWEVVWDRLTKWPPVAA